MAYEDIQRHVDMEYVGMGGRRVQGCVKVCRNEMCKRVQVSEGMAGGTCGRGWRGGSMSETICCSCRRLGSLPSTHIGWLMTVCDAQFQGLHCHL